jgi:hypothetical protein
MKLAYPIHPNESDSYNPGAVHGVLQVDVHAGRLAIKSGECLYKSRRSFFCLDEGIVQEMEWINCSRCIDRMFRLVQIKDHAFVV